MKNAEIQAFVKANAVKSLNLANATQIGDFTYAIPVEVEGETRYAKLVLTCTNNKATKTTEAFDLESAVAEYAKEKAYKAKVAEAKAKAKADKAKAKA